MSKTSMIGLMFELMSALMLIGASMIVIIGTESMIVPIYLLLIAIVLSLWGITERLKYV